VASRSNEGHRGSSRKSGDGSDDIHDCPSHGDKTPNRSGSRRTLSPSAASKSPQKKGMSKKRVKTDDPENTNSDLDEEAVKNMSTFQSADVSYDTKPADPSIDKETIMYSSHDDIDLR